MKPVIFCGGVGSKMWPLSRASLPKHFQPLLNGQSLFQKNYQALRLKFAIKDIFVETTSEQTGLVRKQVPEIPIKNIFIEPQMRNHGPAMGLMAIRLSAIDPDDPFVLIQADVLRQPEKKFLAFLDQVEELIKEKKCLVTGGIRQKSLVGGVDYLVAKKSQRNVYQMEEWLGRDQKIDGLDLTDRSVFIHANHYAWTPRLLLDSYRRLAPNWYQPLMEIARCLGTAQEESVIAREYAKMDKGPVELVTKLELPKGYLVELPFDWTDFGTWESLYQFLKKSKQIPKDPDFFSLDSQNCYLHRSGKKFVALLGVKDLIVVDTGDALLICQQGSGASVGKVVDYLKENNRQELL
ncbi:MAG: sugar phosphate nucleotidyltransferase [Patescibacteria group bacterium]